MQILKNKAQGRGRPNLKSLGQRSQNSYNLGPIRIQQIINENLNCEVYRHAYKFKHQSQCDKQRRGHSP